MHGMPPFGVNPYSQLEPPHPGMHGGMPGIPGAMPPGMPGGVPGMSGMPGMHGGMHGAMHGGAHGGMHGGMHGGGMIGMLGMPGPGLGPQYGPPPMGFPPIPSFNAAPPPHRMPVPDPRRGGRDECKDFLRGICNRGSNCKFYHAQEAVAVEPAHYHRAAPSQPPLALYGGRQMCRDFANGRCTRGDGCRYAHIEEEKVSFEF